MLISDYTVLDISPLWWLVTVYGRLFIVMVSDCTLEDILIVISDCTVLDIFIVMGNCTVVDISLWWSVAAHWRTSSPWWETAHYRTSSHCGHWWLHTGGYLLTVMMNDCTMESIFLQMSEMIRSLSWFPSHEMLLNSATFKRNITIDFAIFNTNSFTHV